VQGETMGKHYSSVRERGEPKVGCMASYVDGHQFSVCALRSFLQGAIKIESRARGHVRANVALRPIPTRATLGPHVEKLVVWRVLWDSAVVGVAIAEPTKI